MIPLFFVWENFRFYFLDNGSQGFMSCDIKTNQPIEKANI